MWGRATCGQRKLISGQDFIQDHQQTEHNNIPYHLEEQLLQHRLLCQGNFPHPHDDMPQTCRLVRQNIHHH